MSADTRDKIAPTVRQAIRINSVTAVLEHWVASHATVSSKSRVWPTPWRAHGTWSTVGPCSRHETRGASASNQTGTVPRSSARHRRRPSPRSNHGPRRPQRPHRREAPLRGRTETTTAPMSSSNTTASMTVRASRNTCCHTLAFRTPFCPSLRSLQTARNVGTRTGCTRGWATQPPTDTSWEPKWGCTGWDGV